MRLIALLLVVIAAGGAEASAAVFRAGAYAIDVTPEKFPVIINGNFTEKTANAAFDRLHARCLILDDGDIRVGLVVVDSCMMPREFLDRTKQLAAQQAGLRVENILICATHTHSAPASMGCLGSDADPNYPPFLQAQIVRGLAKAAEKLTPAKVGWAIGDATGYTHNRRWILRPDKIRNDPFGRASVRANMHPGYLHPDFVGPCGPVDPGLTVLAVQSLDGPPIAVLCNLSMHYFGSAPVSSDYFGPFCDRLQKLIARDDHPASLVAMMSQGTSGDLMWMDYGSPKANTTLAQYADGVAKVAFEAFKRIEYREKIPLKMVQRSLELSRRVPNEERLAWAKPILEKLGAEKPKTQSEVYAREVRYLREEPKRELLLQALRIGDLGIAAIPNEVFAITGLKLKMLSPLQPTFTIELANGADGYIPPPEQHKLGGYTTWPARTAALEEEAEPKIVEQVLAMFEEVSGKKRQRFEQADNPHVQAILNMKPAALWSMGEIAGHIAGDRLGKHPAAYEDGIALFLEGPTLAGDKQGEGNRCPHFAGGRMKASLKDLGATYSVAFWFWNGMPAKARPVTGYLFSRGQDSNANARGDHLGIGGTQANAGKLIFFTGAAKQPPLAGRTELGLRQWHHVASVRDGRKVRVYLDGDPKPQIDGEVDANWAKESSLFFGGRSDGYANFAGKIDEAAVFDRALSADEVKRIYQSAAVKN